MLKKFLAILAMFYAAVAFAAVDVNTGSAADLDSVKGIGPGLSGKIVAERQKGQFKDWNDFVTRVKGVGEKSAAKLSTNGLTVNGAAYAGAPAAAPKAKKDKVSPTSTTCPPTGRTTTSSAMTCSTTPLRWSTSTAISAA